MKASNQEGEYLDTYVSDWLADRLGTIEVTLKMIEITRQRVAPLEHMLKAVEAFARTPGLPDRAVEVFDSSLREVIDKVALDYNSLRGAALLALGRDLLEPVTEGGKALKPKGAIKKDYKWVTE